MRLRQARSRIVILSLGVGMLSGPSCSDASPEPPPVARCGDYRIERADGSCFAPGVATCGTGFVSDERGGCQAVLPETPCDAGLMALPGETACREVMPCGSSQWGDIPVEATNEYVDASYRGASSDGSESAPWTTIQDAIDAAAPGAIVAVAEGTYGGPIIIEDKSVRLWGRCPARVAIVIDEPVQAAVLVLRADGTEVRGISISGLARGIRVEGLKAVLLDRLWIHDTTLAGVLGYMAWSDTALTMRDSLLEHTSDVGILSVGATTTIERTVVRDTQPLGSTMQSGRGIEGRGHYRDLPLPVLTVAHVLVERTRSGGILLAGIEGHLSDVLVRETLPDLASENHGDGIIFLYDTQSSEKAFGTISRSVVERSRGFGLLAVGSDVAVEDTTIATTEPDLDDGSQGDGMAVVRYIEPGSLQVLRSKSSDNRRAGIASFGANVAVGESITHCNVVALAGENVGYVTFNEVGDAPYLFQDLGDNFCGCSPRPETCHVLSSQLSVPELEVGEEPPIDPSVPCEVSEAGTGVVQGWIEAADNLVSQPDCMAGAGLSLLQMIMVDAQQPCTVGMDCPSLLCFYGSCVMMGLLADPPDVDFTVEGALSSYCSAKTAAYPQLPPGEYGLFGYLDCDGSDSPTIGDFVSAPPSELSVTAAADLVVRAPLLLLDRRCEQECESAHVP